MEIKCVESIGCVCWTYLNRPGTFISPEVFNSFKTMINLGGSIQVMNLGYEKPYIEFTSSHEENVNLIYLKLEKLMPLNRLGSEYWNHKIMYSLYNGNS